MQCKEKLERVNDWLTKSGLKVNESKTDLCLFHKRSTAPIEIIINGTTLKSKQQINVLGVIFDQKLQWSEQVAYCGLKSSRALGAIRIIRRFFSTRELLQLVTSNVYSLLYYNSEIWHLPSLKQTLKVKLLSLSSHALKVCMKYDSSLMSFENIHKLNQRALPCNYMLYRQALTLYRIWNSQDYSLEWCAINFNQVLTSRQVNFAAINCSKLRIGQNAFANRLFVLNNRIPLAWFNSTRDTFKIKCKKEFL